MRNASPPRSGRSGARFQRAVARGVLAVFLLTLPGSPPVRAEISGEQVVAGEASFHQEGGILQVTASDGAIIQYDLLNVLSHEELHFLLPHDQATVLNEVLHGATHIDGGLFSNGIVYILNPAGIFFGGDAVVDVNGLVAAAGSMSHEDFLAGVDRFDLSGAVVNQGAIQAPRVALLGTVVANRGDIVAPDGTIALVAGERVLLTRPGGHLHVEVDGAAGGAEAPAIQQTGNVDAGRGQVSFVTGDVWSLAVNHEGITRGREIELRAGSGTVQVSGRLDASDAAPGATGGDIAVTGERVALVDAELDASGDAGGGRIRVGGDLRGAGELPNARRTYVDDESVLRADAAESGDGGEVVVWADEATAFHGRLSARGGAAGGDGGAAEISGAALWSTGEIDLGAARGERGTLLYDPQDIEIVGGTADGTGDPDLDDDRLEASGLGQVLFGDVGASEPFQIYESEIEGTAADIVLEATNSIASSGSFTNEAAGEGVGVLRISDGSSLTMRTRNDPGDDLGSAATPGIDLAGLDLQTRGGSVRLETGDGAIAVGGIDTSGADGATGGAAGAIVLIARDPDASGTSDIAVSGALTARGGGGSAGGGGDGGTVDIRTFASSETGEGGGSVSLASSVDTSGGDGATGGGQGGFVTALATGLFTASGGLTTRGGDGADGDGGSAGRVIVRTADGSIVVGAIDARGGDGTSSAGTGRAGTSRPVILQAGDPDDPGATGSLVLLGNVDARDGTGDVESGFIIGGSHELSAVDAIEHGGQAGPHFRTDVGVGVILSATDIGASAPLVVEGGGEGRNLALTARGRADVQASGFDGVLSVVAQAPTADIDLVQTVGGGSDVIDLSGSGSTLTANRVDSTASGVGVEILLDNPDDAASDGTLEIATGAVTAGGDLFLGSDGDLVLGTADGVAISMRADPAADPGDPTTAGALDVRADFDGDGSGGIRDAAGATGAIDLLGDADEAGTLFLAAGDGIGLASDPITLQGGGSVGAVNQPRTPNPDFDPDDPSSGPEFLADPAAASGIYLRHVDSGAMEPRELAIAGAVIDAGTGAIAIHNETGDLAVEGIVSALPAEGDGAGGDVALGVAAPGSRITSDGDLRVEAGGTITLDADAVETAGSQSFSGDVALARDTAFRSLADDVGFGGALDTAGGVPVAASVEGSVVRFGGDVGGSAPLSGLDVTARDGISFTADGDQSVTTDVGGIRLAVGSGPIPPPEASVSKRDGGLRLESSGAVAVADGQKLSVQGALEIDAASVRVTDLSALSIDVVSPDTQVFAREAALFTLRDGTRAHDGGSDLVANRVSFSSAPRVVGGGPAPRIATQSGAAAGAGALAVTRLPRPLSAADLVSFDGATVLDLGIPVPDPGHETPELEGGPVESPKPLRITADASEPGAWPAAAEVVAYLRCADGRGATPGCAGSPRVRPGSALDTERARELALRYRELLGDGPDARAGRRALAEVAGDAAASLAGPGTAGAGRRYLGELAQLLAQIRLLGLDAATRAAVDREVLDAVRSAIGPDLSAERLEQAVRASGPGLRI